MTELTRRGFLKVATLTAALALAAPEIVFAEIERPKPALIGVPGYGRRLLEFGVSAYTDYGEIVLARPQGAFPLRKAVLAPGFGGLVCTWSADNPLVGDWYIHVAGQNIRELAIYTIEMNSNGELWQRSWDESGLVSEVPKQLPLLP